MTSLLMVRVAEEEELAAEEEELAVEEGELAVLQWLGLWLLAS